MRLLILAPTDRATPAARFALDFARHACLENHEAVLFGIYRGLNLPHPTELGDEADRREVPFRILQQRFRLDPGPIGQLDVALRRLKPDLVQFHGWAALPLARAPQRRRVAWQIVGHAAPVAATKAGEGRGGGNGLAGADGAVYLPPRRRLRLLRQCPQIVVQSPMQRAALAEQEIAAERLLTFPPERVGADGEPDERLHWLLQNAERAARMAEF